MGHVHLLIHYPPKVCFASLVNSLKGVSSRIFAKQFGKIHRHYYKGVLCSPGCFAGGVGGAPISVLKQNTSSNKIDSLRLPPEGRGFTGCLIGKFFD